LLKPLRQEALAHLEDLIRQAPEVLIKSGRDFLQAAALFAELADEIEAAVGRVLDKGLRTPDIMAKGCKEVGTEAMGEAVLAEL
jgi:3-isopropylmalate dehydrogenase